MELDGASAKGFWGFGALDCKASFVGEGVVRAGFLEADFFGVDCAGEEFAEVDFVADSREDAELEATLEGTISSNPPKSPSKFVSGESTPLLALAPFAFFGVFGLALDSDMASDIVSGTDSSAGTLDLPLDSLLESL